MTIPDFTLPARPAPYVDTAMTGYRPDYTPVPRPRAEMAVHDDGDNVATGGDQDEGGSVFVGVCYGLMVAAVIAAVLWAGYEVGLLNWFKANAPYIIGISAVVILGAIAMHRGIRDGMNGK